jgi:AcrR family transcriptional regulator
MSPRNKDQNETIRKASISKIINASIELFSKQGFETTSVSHIAKKAGISKGLIYNYFDSKQALLKGVFDYFTSEEENIMVEVADEDPKIFLGNLFRFTFRELRDRPEFWKMVMGMSIQPDMYSFVHEMAVEKMNVYFPLLEELLNGCGVKHAHQEAKLLAAQLDGIVIHFLLVREGYPLIEIENYLIEKYCK